MQQNLFEQFIEEYNNYNYKKSLDTTYRIIKKYSNNTNYLNQIADLLNKIINSSQKNNDTQTQFKYINQLINVYEDDSFYIDAFKSLLNDVINLSSKNNDIQQQLKYIDQLLNIYINNNDYGRFLYKNNQE